MAMEKIGYDGALMLEVRNSDTTTAVLERSRRACLKLEELLESSVHQGEPGE